MSPYDSFRYIYPTRPEQAVPSSELKSYDNGQWIAQPKLNGDCMPIFTNGIETHVFDRHNKKFSKKITLEPSFGVLHRQTMPSEKPKWMGLVGEYMIKSKKNEHNEVWNEKLVIHDILVYDGMHLLGQTFKQRVLLLDQIYGKEDMILHADGVQKLNFMYSTPVKDVFRVKTYFDLFAPLWNDLIKIDMYEGLVLKRADAKLEPGNSELNNNLSQLKFRKKTKNYRF
jgi:hypothetical protein